MTSQPFLTLDERRQHGIDLRTSGVGRTDQATWKLDVKRRDPVATVRAANTGRLPELIPIKMWRMSRSPFAFFRGSASLMASDLAESPATGLRVQLCGDAHVRNLGAYAAPDGHLVFDLNDFDETTPGPWEWDLKRLAASFVLSGREAGDSDENCAKAVKKLVRSYRETLETLSHLKALDLARYEIKRFKRRGLLRSVLQKAERLTPAKTMGKLTERVNDGTYRFKNAPPVLYHVDDATRKCVLLGLKSYRDTVGAGRQTVLDAYRVADVAFKVVGTGSVGTRDYVVLLFGTCPEDPMFLQVKEALPSCYAPFVGVLPAEKHNGRRVAQGQQRMQTVTDPFLGWTSVAGRQFLVRQLADRKAAIDPADLQGTALFEYAAVCGEVLAKAHARTGDSAAISGYCGDTAKLDGAIAESAETYADQMTSDFEAFTKAIKAGKIKTEEG